MQALQKPINEKIYKKTKSRSGKTVFNKQLIGHLIAGVVDGRVAIGYSLLHRNDLYDMVNGQRRPGHGKNLAQIRALKWLDKDVIEVPPSIAKQTRKFRDRCERYYKDATVPDINEQEVVYPPNMNNLLAGLDSKTIERGAKELLDKIANL